MGNSGTRATTKEDSKGRNIMGCSLSKGTTRLGNPKLVKDWRGIIQGFASMKLKRNEKPNKKAPVVQHRTDKFMQEGS
ncbi:hypothetical protein E3N88_26662 [Mikania micrantha]|uniref:Uncharacterized protein n=1 Tax=Mikania micrantha TaxID=192012 RepID=A0A5N6MV52_9ASTR|nr:hypothetical protein E3N88_26662 [Mikania micrantha]